MDVQPPRCPSPSRRRVVAVAVAAACPFHVAAQPRPARRIGVLSPEPAGSAASGTLQRVLRETLRRMGYAEGTNLAIEWRFAEGRLTRLPELAGALLQAKCELIVAVFPNAIAAAAAATKTVPVVMLGGYVAIGQGLVQSLQKPGGNVTGTLLSLPDEAGRLATLVKEIAPTTDRIAVLAPHGLPGRAQYRAALEKAAGPQGIVLRHHAIGRNEDVAAVWRRPEPQKPSPNPDALLILGDVAMDPFLPAVVALASQRKLPTASTSPLHVRQGILLSHAPRYVDLVERTALFVHKVLSGSAPGGVAVEPPKQMELLANAKALAALGVSMPAGLKDRARIVD
jgi:putative ABC transport system substrate-binding protein